MASKVRAWRRATERKVFSRKAPSYLWAGGTLFYRLVGDQTWKRSAQQFTPKELKEGTHFDGAAVFRELTHAQAKKLNAARLKAARKRKGE